MGQIDGVGYSRNLIEEEAKSYHGAFVKYFYDRREAIEARVGTFVTRIFSFCCYSLDRLGLCPSYHTWQKFKDYERFGREVEKVSPPLWKETAIKTSEKAMNQCFYFAVSGNFLFYREREGETDWKPLYTPPGVVTEVKADGANLAVGMPKQFGKEIKQLLYTKKTLQDEEWRSEKVYSYRDIAADGHWRSSYFYMPLVRSIPHLPFVKPLVSLTVGELKLTRLSEGDPIALSHRGRYNGYYIDPEGKRHYDSHGVSMMLTLHEGELFYADPYLFGGFCRKLELPKNFTPRSLDASASSILLLGEKVGERGEVVTALFHRMVDYDILGYNLFYWLMGWYCEKKGAGEGKMLLPPKDWEEIELPSDDEGKSVGDEITIEQVGKGNDERRITLPFIDEKGDVVLLYQKMLRDREWKRIEECGEEDLSRFPASKEV